MRLHGIDGRVGVDTRPGGSPQRQLIRITNCSQFFGG